MNDSHGIQNEKNTALQVKLSVITTFWARSIAETDEQSRIILDFAEFYS